MLIFLDEQLKNWWTCMRTRYGKLTKLPSGSGTPELTDRETWILSTFAYLKPYMIRRKGRNNLSDAESLSDTDSAAGSSQPPRASSPETSTKRKTPVKKKTPYKKQRESPSRMRLQSSSTDDGTNERLISKV